MYTVYQYPEDYPEKFVVRMWFVMDGKPVPNEEPHAIVDNLEQARKTIPKGLAMFPRAISDHLCVVETWL